MFSQHEPVIFADAIPASFRRVDNLATYCRACQSKPRRQLNPASAIFKLTTLQSRAATAENPTAAPGEGGRVGDGLKGSPAIKLFRAGATATLLDTAGPGLIRHLWCTPSLRKPRHLRNLILRAYWENSATPSVEAPLGDFFGIAHGAAAPFNSHFLVNQEGRGFNCYFPMPFARRAVVTVTNETGEDIDWFFYQIDFTLGDEVGDDDGRFHARFQRANPCAYGHDFTILETAGARGVYAGCVLGVRPLAPLWWGEGEVKIYLDADTDHPTICGTGLEDYAGSAWGLETHAAPYQGAPYVNNEHKLYSLYRLHVPDPVYFQRAVRVTVQQMGAAHLHKARELYGDRLIYRPKNHPRRKPEDSVFLRSDDYCATAFWYQWPLAPATPFPDHPARSASLAPETEAHNPLANF